MEKENELTPEEQERKEEMEYQEWKETYGWEVDE